MSILRRLYRGETNLDFVGYRKRWYIASVVIILLCLGSMVFRGFNWGVEFAGGSQFQVPAKPGVALEEVRDAIERRGIEVTSAQTAGQAGQQQRYVIRTPALSDEQRNAAVSALVEASDVPADQVSANSVSSSWGKSITNQALIALVVFLVVVSAFIWIRFEQKMAVAAIAALGHDLLLTAGVYSMVGFEVSPSTVVGLLTILGFSLYDTVVTFDKVEENARGVLGGSRQTYPEAANLALNQTLMRSINTSLIALLPVSGLLFVGAGLLGVGTLKDLALVLFVGMLTGAYSSLFLATPWLVDMKLMDPRYKLHTQRVLAKRSSVAKAADSGAEAKAGARGRPRPGPAATTSADEEADVSARVDELASSSAPRVGTKPAGPRPAGARSGGTRSGGAKAGQRKRPGGGSKRR